MTPTALPLEDAPPAVEVPAVLRVSASSDVKALSGAIAGCVRHTGSATLEVIGAGALNQAVKAAVVARAVTAREGLDLVVMPAFHTVELDGHRRTALRLLVTHRPPPADESRSPSDVPDPL